MKQNSFAESGNSPPSADPSSSTDTRTSDKGVAGISVWWLDQYGNMWESDGATFSRIGQVVAKRFTTGGIKPSPANKD